MITIHIAKYEDGMYPEDNYILGAYLSPEVAQERIDYRIECEKLNNPHSNKCRAMRYYIDEIELSATKEELLAAVTKED